MSHDKRMKDSVRRGDVVRARTAFDTFVTRRAATSPMMGDDFLVVRVCTEEEWERAEREGREPASVPWPAEDVELLERAREAREAEEMDR